MNSKNNPMLIAVVLIKTLVTSMTYSTACLDNKDPRFFWRHEQRYRCNILYVLKDVFDCATKKINVTMPKWNEQTC